MCNQTDNTYPYRDITTEQMDQFLDILDAYVDLLAVIQAKSVIKS